MLNLKEACSMTIYVMTICAILTVVVATTFLALLIKRELFRVRNCIFKLYEVTRKLAEVQSNQFDQLLELTKILQDITIRQLKGEKK